MRYQCVTPRSGEDRLVLTCVPSVVLLPLALRCSASPWQAPPFHPARPPSPPPRRYRWRGSGRSREQRSSRRRASLQNAFVQSALSVSALPARRPSALCCSCASSPSCRCATRSASSAPTLKRSASTARCSISWLQARRLQQTSNLVDRLSADGQLLRILRRRLRLQSVWLRGLARGSAGCNLFRDMPARTSRNAIGLVRTPR